jgi:hypothetical protein
VIVTTSGPTSAAAKVMEVRSVTATFELAENNVRVTTWSTGSSSFKLTVAVEPSCSATGPPGSRIR